MKATATNIHSYSKWYFAFFRIIFGVYLSVHFWDLIGSAAEIWSDKGSIGDPKILPSYGMFPNVLFWYGSPSFVSGFVCSLFLAAILFLIGYFRQIMALFLWYGWACLLGRNPFIANPGIPFIGLLLLACVLIPHGEPLSLQRNTDEQDWRMPYGIFEGFWVIMALGYTLSGLHKCLSTSWADGSAIIHLLNNPLARDNELRQLMLGAPEVFLRWNTWGVLSLEIFFAPLCFFHLTRRWAWLAMIGMHLGIMSLVNFADLTLGVLMIHLFTFDERWLPPRKTETSPVLFFDGVCGLCNGFIKFLFDIDRTPVFKVATLQGVFAQQKVPGHVSGQLNSLVVLTDDSTVLTKSRAVLWLLDRVGGIWRVFSRFARLVPYPVADVIYDLVAQNRYKFFGKLDSCRMPTDEERSRFLS